MAHIWIQLADQSYGIAVLNGPWFVLTDDPERPVVTKQGGRSRVVLRHYDGELGTRWILLTDGSRAVRVNGYPLWGGLRVLVDRDEIRVRGGFRGYFSVEELTHVEPYPGGSEAARCPRCQDSIQHGSESVRCPACGIWHHQQEEERLCWSYAPGCAVCGQSTDFDSGYRWTPAEL